MISLEIDSSVTNWVSPPSVTILRLIYQKQFNLYLFRLKTEMTVEDFMNLLYDKIRISSKLASQLSELLGGSQAFWINRYTQFEEELTGNNERVLSKNLKFLENLSKIRNISIEMLLHDFKVSTYEHLMLDYVEGPQIMYSRSQRIEPSPANIANWIRNCELLAERTILEQPVHIFSNSQLEDQLGEILALTKVNSINKIVNKLKKMLLKCGVVLVLSPSEKGNGVSGLTKTLLKKYRLVVVTDRYKNNAAFWFTLLHELAHCLLHSIVQPIVHYSDEEFTLASLPTNNIFEEEEANSFVEELIFTDDLMTELEDASRSYKKVMRLAVKYDISSALLVAQIHREKLAPYSHFRKVYKKTEFNSIL